MKSDQRFLGLSKDFWAHVRLISEHLGYTDRTTHQIKIPSFQDQVRSLEALGMSSKKIADHSGKPTDFGQQLGDYFDFRAHVLNIKHD